MIYFCFTKRYQSVGEVLRALEDSSSENTNRDSEVSQHSEESNGLISNSDIAVTESTTSHEDQNQFRKTVLIGTSLILAISVFTAYWQRLNFLSLFNPTCTSEIGDYLSCGEEILYTASKSNQRVKANQAVVKGDYELAFDYYQKSWKRDGRDAETLLYMNNAFLESTNANYYTADNGNTIILSGSPLVNSKIEQIKTDRPTQLIATSYWHPLVAHSGAFTITSQQLWETKINDRTATAYNATLAFIEAIKLQNNLTRKGILNQLSTEGFSFYGATGHIRFNNPINGDRVNFFPTLVHLVPCKNSDRFYEFVPIKYANAQAAGLNCNLN